MRTILALLAFAALTFAEPEPVRVPAVVDLQNKKDPVSGAAARPGNDLVWHGLRIHFANAATGAKFQDKPAAYLEKLGVAMAGKLVDLKNTKCPVTGKAVDGKTFHDADGVRTRLSGPDTAAKLKAEPAKGYARLGYRYEAPVVDLRNEFCPVTGGTCYPEAPIWIDVEAIRIRVCCDKCVAEVKDNPARVLKSLMIDPAKLKKKYGLR